MATITKTYFLCPTSEIIHPPPIGPLKLGAILRSTSAPQQLLNGAAIVPVPNPYPPVVETDWQKTFGEETGFGLGVYAQFLQLAGVGGELGGEHSSKTENVFAFDTVTTTAFEPTAEYVAQSVKAPAVQQYLQARRFSLNTSLFLVTGLKLVKGARIKYSTSVTTKVSGNVGVDLTALGVPVNVGPKGHWTRKRADETGLSRGSEFVFAFRVKRLRAGRKKVTSEEYTKGAFLSSGEGKENDELILVDDVDGAEIKGAVLVTDAVDGESVYCVPA